MIGIYGGTFDPPHKGHVCCALGAFAELELEHLYVVPAKAPRLRGVPGARPEQRLAMTRAAFSEAHEAISVDDCELARDGIETYAIDTINDFAKRHPGATLVLILGRDALAKFCQWHEYQAILKLCHLVVMARPGEPLEQPQPPEELMHRLVTDKDSLKAEKSGKIFLSEVNMLNISATMIRDKIANGKEFENLVPPKVFEYITEHQLYQA